MLWLGWRLELLGRLRTGGPLSLLTPTSSTPYGSAHSAEAPLSLAWLADHLALIRLSFYIVDFLSKAWCNQRFPFGPVSTFLTFLPSEATHQAWWKKQIVVVTGGSSGLGREIVLLCLARGASVVSLDLAPPADKDGPDKGTIRVIKGEDDTDIDGNPLRTVHYDFTPGFYSQTSRRFAHVQIDVSKREQVDSAGTIIPGLFGGRPPTMLVNNAGVHGGVGQTLLSTTASSLERTVGVNICAQLWTLRAFLPAMINRGEGHIVTISSTLGFVGVARAADYSATKHALVGLHTSLRHELDHVHVIPPPAPASASARNSNGQDVRPDPSDIGKHPRRVRTTLVILGRMRTPLFARMRYSALAEFLAPSLAPADVARRIVNEALETQQSTTIYAPFYAHFAPLFHVLPGFVEDWAHWITGANHAMEEEAKATNI